MAHLIIILSGLFFISSVEAFDLCDFYPDHPLCVVPEGPVISISPSNEYGSLQIGTSEQQFCATVTDNNDTGLAASVEWTSDKLGVLGSGECCGSTTLYNDIRHAIVWESDVDGYLGDGSDISTSLSVGQHFVRARVTDTRGRKDITAVKVTITP